MPHTDPRADRHACRCGHDAAVHEHLRRGSNCALCWCPEFTPPAPRPGPLGGLLLAAAGHLRRRATKGRHR